MIDAILNPIRSAIRSLVDFFRDYPRLVSHSDAFSLGWIQLYVGVVENADQTTHPGISFQMPRQGWPINRAVALPKEKAIEFVDFLTCLDGEQLPCKICFPRHDGNIEWEVVKTRSKWHGGGGLVGYLKGNWLADHSNPAKVIITKISAAELRRCIVSRYKLPAASAP